MHLTAIMPIPGWVGRYGAFWAIKVGDSPMGIVIAEY